jgi:hypothetical protein
MTFSLFPSRTVFQSGTISSEIAHHNGDQAATGMTLLQSVGVLFAVLFEFR